MTGIKCAVAEEIDRLLETVTDCEYWNALIWFRQRILLVRPKRLCLGCNHDV